jgi:hypothetical protein
MRLDLRLELGRPERRGAEGPHPARVRAGVAVKDALVVARRLERAEGLAVGDGEDRDLLADEALLDHHARAGVAELAPPHHAVDRVGRFTRVLRDDDPLARREPVGLDDDREGADLLGHVELGHVRLVEQAEVGGGNVVLAEQVLGEDLAPLELRRRLARTEDELPRRRQPVGQPEHQRDLRPDDRQVDLRLDREAGDPLDVVGREVEAGAELRERVAPRRDEELGRPRRAADRLRERMLATARTDQQDLHEALRATFPRTRGERGARKRGRETSSPGKPDPGKRRRSSRRRRRSPRPGCLAKLDRASGRRESAKSSKNYFPIRRARSSAG